MEAVESVEAVPTKGSVLSFGCLDLDLEDPFVFIMDLLFLTICLRALETIVLVVVQ